ncbi:unnamed protein product [Periconia digitata]|uniref:Uncharacterized protein n=1 Tax=Periconia digitata TaxID=1303443 RepID=A0A9W4UAM7_9PLEO|nr:unnamed protein product [Periconia digitata]
MSQPTITVGPDGDFFRGPLSTLFQPPASCSLYTIWEFSDVNYLWMAHDKFVPYHDPNCLPPPNEGVDLSKTESWFSYYYSPGICPQGWQTATTFTSSFPGFNGVDGLKLGSDTSAALCCPSGFTYTVSDWGQGNLCGSSIKSGQQVAYFWPTDSTSYWDHGPVYTTTVTDPTSVLGHGIPIWWQKTDEAMLASAAQASTTMIPPSTSFSTTSPPKSRSTKTGPAATGGADAAGAGEEKDGLSVGAKIGVGLGAGVGVIAALCFILFLLHRKKQRNKTSEYAGVNQDVYAGSPAATDVAADVTNSAYSTGADSGVVPPSYHDQKVVYELRDSREVGELDASAPVTRPVTHEMPA